MDAWYCSRSTLLRALLFCTSLEMAMADRKNPSTAVSRIQLKRYVNLPLLVALVLIVFSFLNLERTILQPKQISIVCDRINYKKFSGEILKFYKNGQIHTRARVKLGLIQGHATVWRKDGILESDRMYYANGNLAYVKRWYKNGQLAESYMARKVMDPNKRQSVFVAHGQYKSWYANGQLKHSASYSDGILIAQTKRVIVNKIPLGFWNKNGKKLKNSSIPKTIPAIPLVPKIWYELGAKNTKCISKGKRRRKH